MLKLLLSIFLLTCIVSCTEQPYKTDGHMDVKLPDQFGADQGLESEMDSSAMDSLSNSN